MTINLTGLSNFKDWKSTASAFCSLVIALSASAAFLSHLSPAHAAILITAGGVAKQIIGIISTDGTQVQLPAGTKVDATLTTPGAK